MLLFARSPHAEAAAKPDLGSRSDLAACALMRARASATATQSGLPVVEWDERRQRGASFGERLSHAVTQVLSLGFRHVVIVGGDCPDLRPADITAAAAEVERGREVIGTDRRGGAYLVAIGGRHFDGHRFAALPWETTSLAAGFVAYCAEYGGEPARLAIRRDVNARHDLIVVARRFRGLRGWARLASSACPKRAQTDRQSPAGRRGRAAPHMRRGPPVAV